MIVDLQKYLSNVLLAKNEQELRHWVGKLLKAKRSFAVDRDNNSIRTTPEGIAVLGESLEL